MPDQVPGNLDSLREGLPEGSFAADAGGRELRLQTEYQFYRKIPAQRTVVAGATVRITVINTAFTKKPENNDIQSVCDKLTSMSTSDSNSHVFEPAAAQDDVSQQIRDISEVPAIEVITTAAVHLMSAAAVKLASPPRRMPRNSRTWTRPAS